MASPQCENGYTRLANELLEALCSYRIGGQELRVVLFIVRKTYGFGKKHDKISYGQISKATNIPRKRVAEHVKVLAEKRVLYILNNGEREPLTMGITKDYEQWEYVPKKGDIPNNKDKSVPNNGDHKRKKKQKEIPSVFFEFSRRFLEYQQAQLGEKLIKITTKKIEDGAITLEKLENLDGYSLKDDIRPVLHCAVKDDSTQIRSLASLRKNGSNGEMKFTNVFAAYKQSKPAQKVVEDIW